MKKASLICLFLVILSYSVMAGDVLKLDFTQSEQHLIGLKDGDMAEFYLNGERNIIIVDKIKPDGVDLTAFVAQETNGYPYYTSLSQKRSLKLDIERDNIDDLYVNYHSSSEDLEYAYLLLKRVNNGVTGNVVKDPIREKRKYDKYVIAGFFCAIFLLIFFKYYLRRKHSKK